MEIALGSKRKMCFVNGTIPRPSETDPSYEDWMQCDLMISSWIINSCSKDVAPCVRYSTAVARFRGSGETAVSTTATKLRRGGDEAASGRRRRGDLKYELGFEPYFLDTVLLVEMLD